MINAIRIKYFPRLRKRLLLKYQIDYNRRNYYIIEKNFVPIFFGKRRRRRIPDENIQISRKALARLYSADSFRG